MMVYSNIEDVAEFYLKKRAMSNKKLNKILYYAYSWTLTLLNDIEVGIENKLFSEKFEAWVHGPVCPIIYHKYKKYGWEDIPQTNFEKSLPPQIVEVLDEVWNVYSEYSADELESMTHQELPWREIRIGLSPFDPCDKELNDETIFRYYTEMMTK
ncbi:MAG: Panacea domain-containing protein [Bacillota bacterium]